MIDDGIPTAVKRNRVWKQKNRTETPTIPIESLAQALVV